jgi:hypothetical protein
MNIYPRLRAISIVAAFVTTMLATPFVSADLISEAAKIGANAGAMDYCERRIAKGDDKSKYKLLSISTYKEFDDLDSSDKAKALVYKKAAEDGDYLGDPLDRGRCDSLRKMLFLKYN